MATPSIVATINDFLEARKTLEGSATWRDMGHHGQFRLIFPIHIDGVSTGFDFEICAYPNIVPLRFTISIRQPLCIWRIDYSETDVHTNSLNAPSDIAGLTIVGVHYHAWSDNSRFVTSSQLPKNMKNARPLSKDINNFEAAFEWLCREINIELPEPGEVVLPARTELF